jgi:hypothetical protein
VQLGATQEKLQAAGVETLAVVITLADRARLYFRYRPTRAIVLADPDARTHRAFGVPRFEVVPDDDAAGSQWPAKTTVTALRAARVNPTGELPAALPVLDAINELNRKDGFELTDVDEQLRAASGSQLAGHFLVDRDGIVRWTHVEARERLADVTKFPSEAEILAAMHTLRT